MEISILLLDCPPTFIHYFQKWKILVLSCILKRFFMKALTPSIIIVVAYHKHNLLNFFGKTMYFSSLLWEQEVSWVLSCKLTNMPFYTLAVKSMCMLISQCGFADFQKTACSAALISWKIISWLHYKYVWRLISWFSEGCCMDVDWLLTANFFIVIILDLFF